MDIMCCWVLLCRLLNLARWYKLKSRSHDTPATHGVKRLSVSIKLPPNAAADNESLAVWTIMAAFLCLDIFCKPCNLPASGSARHSIGAGTLPGILYHMQWHLVSQGRITVFIMSPVHASQYTIDTKLLMPLLWGAESVPC